MITLRPGAERGHSQLDWLDSWHTFSFDQYHDPKHMSFGPLRVINEDRIAPGGGFGTHPHRDMEIITYVVEGELQHRDSMGNGSVIKAGEIQKMSAGTGIQHSEFNASKENPVHLLQIWIMPDKRGIAPSYEQERFELKPQEWKLLGGPRGEGLISIEQQVRLYALQATAGSTAEFRPQPGSIVWIQAVKGEFEVGGRRVASGDGASIRDDGPIDISMSADSELLLFEISAR